MFNIENEIDVLESALSNLEMAIGDIQDSPYHSHLANVWEMDVEEIKARLEELYEMQNDIWAKEQAQQEREYIGGAI